jgi:hypothetical protein
MEPSCAARLPLSGGILIFNIIRIEVLSQLA